MATADRFDVVVVGGGPAGSALAMTAARGGVRVVVLEAARFPRDKTCGDALGLDCFRELETLGMLDPVRAVARARARGVCLSGPSGSHVELTTFNRKLPGYSNYTFIVPRIVLDHVLIQGAVEAGAVLREGVKVASVVMEGDRVVGVRCEDGSIIRGDVVVGCAGEHDPVAKVPGRPRDPRRRAFGIRVYYDGLPAPIPLPQISFAEFVLPGYGWIFPTSPTGANVGVGLRADLLRRRGGDLRGLLERFVTEAPVARRLLAGGSRVSSVRGWPLTFGSQAGRSTGPGWMLCGDAAALINPVTGEGIGAALLSGRLAAETILEADLSPAGLSAYERAWRRELGSGFRAGHRVQELMTHPWVIDRVILQSQRHHRLGTEIAAIVSGAHSNARAFAPSTLFQLAF